MVWHSQAGQDAWVHGLIGDSGYFVDVGAHDGVKHSNTFALEQAGWTGICIEPNEAAFGALRESRKCDVCQGLVSSDYGNLPFDGVRVGSGSEVAAWPLSGLLKMHEASDTIDYLSIDVEGHELEVLAGIDFTRWHVRCATIEHNVYCDGPTRKQAIAEIMFAHGFERVREDVVAEGYGPYEDWWVHRDD